MQALSYHPAVLELRGPLTVRAVFERAWHLGNGNAMLTVAAAPYDGPMAIRIGSALPGIAVGTSAAWEGGALRVGAIRVNLAGAREWTGAWAGEPMPVDQAALEGDMRALREAAGEFSVSRVGRGYEALRRAVHAGSVEDLRRAVLGLLGLGPGLTPSGDDVLCGLMAGLSVLGLRPWEVSKRDAALPVHALPQSSVGEPMEARIAALREGVCRVVLEEMEGRTGVLSRTLLLAAARGLAVQPLLDVLWTLGSREPVRGLKEVAAIGHTSGRDMLAGAALAAAPALEGQNGASLVPSP